MQHDTWRRRAGGAPVVGINTDFVAGTIERYALNERYARAVADAGAVPLLIPCLEDTERLDACLEVCDGLLLVGGADYPPRVYGEVPHERTEPMEERRCAADLRLARLALADDIPVLGICAGCQLLCIAAGGRLVQHVAHPERHVALGPGRDREHEVDLVDDAPLLRGVFAEPRIRVNSSHHQAVDPAQPGRGLRIGAWAEDGTVEAVESAAHTWVLGVQWHPERIADAAHRRLLFGRFVQACAASDRRGPPNGDVP